MKTLISLAAGGAVGTIWKWLPVYVKVPTVVGVVLFASSELNTELNQSRFSSQTFAGKAAEEAAKVVDPAATKKAIDTGQPVTGAAATVAAQVQGLSADAKQKMAYADAANESEAEMLAKQAAGKTMTSTEQLRLIELESARQDLSIKRSDAKQRALGVKILKNAGADLGTLPRARVQHGELAAKALDDWNKAHDSW